MAVFCVFINSFRRSVLTKRTTLKFDSFASVRALSIWNVLASLGLRWWQHLIMEDFHEHWIQMLNCDCIAAEVAASRKATYPIINNYIRASPFPSNCAEDDFRPKCRFLLQSVRLNERHLNLLSIVNPTRCSNFSNLFYFWDNTVHVSDGLSVRHQEFKTVHTATGVCQTDTAVCLLASSNSTNCNLTSCNRENNSHTKQ
jgi:hypothetical protein